MSATRPRPPKTGKSLANFKRRPMSQESRERLSQIATERHRNGDFKKDPDAPPPPRRKPSKQRIAERVAEAARDEKTAQDIIDVFKDGIAANQPINIRIKAAEAWIKVEQDDAKLQLREVDAAGQRRDRGELLNILAGRLTSSHSASLLRQQLEERAGITDDDVIDVPARDIIED